MAIFVFEALGATLEVLPTTLAYDINLISLGYQQGDVDGFVVLKTAHKVSVVIETGAAESSIDWKGIRHRTPLLLVERGAAVVGERSAHWFSEAQRFPRLEDLFWRRVLRVAAHIEPRVVTQHRHERKTTLVLSCSLANIPSLETRRM